MPRTRKDLIVDVLDLLGVTQVGQDPSADDVEIVDKRIDGKLIELARRRVIYVQDVDAIDDEVFEHLSRLVANAIGPKFGQARDPGVDLDAEGKLREMQGEPGANDVVRACYY